MAVAMPEDFPTGARLVSSQRHNAMGPRLVAAASMVWRSPNEVVPKFHSVS